ncbi:MAG: biotin--[acetyl-CoA-carboxylase] ligase [Candidatus Latescibacteria bacterium]|nr:biotin--[acetyl-CoA-carboxylase] ligase [Candidatus Latescibacterota bacterium]NIM21046.1 biotin--[acetyl-CoA-carboxylase] ligase [Candidatus Latescibacterota bacterium]NIM65181.1 biotin--[acetyl-CoA-carboxylase] ligase [Candidatus Latescibacterota bacterium]NIO01696.1 biotin--[acetyl-CoA-carboxylase] ligase [Candidatus Latescibacterota bacterium]NIO28213.1 biotin--[acetyl-CoA-carboxylase] ligase [Candidatus Latescibacterota bacterium]
MNEPVRLLPQAVRERLSTICFGQRMYYLPEVDSTNRLASELAKQGESEGTVVIADYQRRGRGRLDRKWESPPMKNLLFSVILRPTGAPADILALTLAFSTAISDVLSDMLGQEILVKWPNDVVAGSRKLCGMLAESASRSGKSMFVIMGVGINVNAASEDFNPSIRDTAASCLTLSGEALDRGEVLVNVLSAMESCYFRFREEGFGAFVDVYNDKLSIIGKTVSFTRGETVAKGKVLGVRPDGALMISPPKGKMILLYGEEISVV